MLLRLFALGVDQRQHAERIARRAIFRNQLRTNETTNQRENFKQPFSIKLNNIDNYRKRTARASTTSIVNAPTAL